MILTIEKKGEIVKAIKAEYTPAEWLVTKNAMYKYAEDEEVYEVDREIVQQMLKVVPVEEEEGED